LGDEELELEEIREALKTFSEVLDGICPATSDFFCPDGLTHATYLVRIFSLQEKGKAEKTWFKARKGQTIAMVPPLSTDISVLFQRLAS
jgi:hypothetical protein